MHVCIPVTEDRGLDSPICPHFGSAPAFLIVDTDTWSCHLVANRTEQREHGQCMPLVSLMGERVDSVIASAMGASALKKLESAGIRVYVSEHPTATDALAALVIGRLSPMQPATACVQGGHAHG